MLDKLKLYFNILGTSQDAILNLIIDNNTDILTSLKADPIYLFSMCVWDYSNYLKSGNTTFQVSQSTDISRFDPDLRDLIYRSIKVQVYS